MAARVDTRAMLVRDGAFAIAFAVDCGAGTAVLDPSGAPHALRLLRWHEKCGLARFVDAGPEFLEAQFVAISGGALPGDAARRDALGALAFWLHGTAPLPLDTALLGEVTLALCAALAIGPAELGALPAPEVETLWHACGAAGAGAGTHAPDSTSGPASPNSLSGMTCIVIEPDPAPGAVAAGDDAARAEEAPPSPPQARDDPQSRGADARRVRDSGPQIAGEPAPLPAGHAPMARDGFGAQASPAPTEESSTPSAQVPAAPTPPEPQARPGERVSPLLAAAPRSRGAAPRFRLHPQGERAPEAQSEGPDPVFPGEGRGPVASGSGWREAASSPPKLGPGLRRGKALDRPDAVAVAAADADAPRSATSRREPLAAVARLDPPFRGETAEPVPDAARTDPRAPVLRPRDAMDTAPALPPAPPASALASVATVEPVATARPRQDRDGAESPAAAAISAMISAVAPSGVRNMAPSPARPAAPRPAGAVAASAPAPAPALDGRLAALVDIVTRSAAPPRDAAPDPDAVIESFGDRLADAVAELGLAGAE
ncbi:MAG: hypothetical protein V4574_09655 [Pseudomonadota bacterium]